MLCAYFFFLFCFYLFSYVFGHCDLSSNYTSTFIAVDYMLVIINIFETNTPKTHFLLEKKKLTYSANKHNIYNLLSTMFLVKSEINLLLLLLLVLLLLLHKMMSMIMMMRFRHKFIYAYIFIKMDSKHIIILYIHTLTLQSLISCCFFFFFFSLHNLLFFTLLSFVSRKKWPYTFG